MGMCQRGTANIGKEMVADGAGNFGRSSKAGHNFVRSLSQLGNLTAVIVFPWLVLCRGTLVMIGWLRNRQDASCAIETEAEKMMKAYGPQAYEISANLAYDMRNKGDSKRAKHWAKVTSYVAEMNKSA
jgi:hypothetical protein